MCCTQLAANTGRKNWPSAHHRTTLSGHIFATEASTIGKKLVKRQYFLHMFSQYGELRPTNGEVGWQVWGTQANFNGFRVLAALLHRRHSREVNQTLHDVWPCPGLIHYIYTIEGSWLLTEFCQVQHNQHSFCVQVLRSPILAALLHGTRVVYVSQTLRRGTRNGIAEPSHRAPPTFDKAAITLGIGPHSSYIGYETRVESFLGDRL